MTKATRIALQLLTPLVLLVSEVSGIRTATAEADDVPPSPGSRILVETSDGNQIEGKLIEITGDSVRVKRGKEELSLGISSLTGAWTKKGNALGGLKAGLVFGAAAGALHGIAAPTDCIECDEERGDPKTVLLSMGANAGVFGLLGILVGAIDKRWETTSIPGSAAGTVDREPFPHWGMSLGVGPTRSLERDDTSWGAVLTGWENASRGTSGGIEYGVLDFAPREEVSRERRAYAPDSLSLIASGSTRVVRDQAWFYFHPLAARIRKDTGTLRTQFELAAGIYSQRTTVLVESKDSTGVVVARSTGSAIDNGLGISVGGGVGYGKGSFRPELRVRTHWVITGRTDFAVTGLLGVEFH